MVLIGAFAIITFVIGVRHVLDGFFLKGLNYSTNPLKSGC